MRKRTLKTCTSALLLAYPAYYLWWWFWVVRVVEGGREAWVAAFNTALPAFMHDGVVFTLSAFGACACAWLLSGSVIIDGGGGWLRWVNVGLWLTAWVLGAWYAFTLM